ncbi:hypothetical protein GGI04_004902 [Coemansia thaxteri]|nr:hypothetical protein GGI04_004902 [Coemansia thaxteri]
MGSSPAIGTLSQLITLSYQFPAATYLELLTMYYKNIGMPGLDTPHINNHNKQLNVNDITSTHNDAFIWSTNSHIKYLNSNNNPVKLWV